MKQTTSLAVLALVNNTSATKIAELAKSAETWNQYGQSTGHASAEEQEAIFEKAKES